MHSTGKVEITPLEDWVNSFDPYHTVKWGFSPELKGIIEQKQKEARELVAEKKKGPR